MQPASAPRTARARARAELTGEIKAAARRQLGEVGAAALSMRAVARELGMASSAVYRYFAERDALLTALIVDAYADIATCAERVVDQTAGAATSTRWMKLSAAIRDWAIENQHEYELIYGTPVPGYAAPTETVEPALRLTRAMLSVVVDGVAAGEISDNGSTSDSVAVNEAFSRLRTEIGVELGDDVLRRSVAAWTQLFGHVSFELFGQFQTVVEDTASFFESQMAEVADRLTARS